MKLKVLKAVTMSVAGIVIGGALFAIASAVFGKPVSPILSSILSDVLGLGVYVLGVLLIVMLILKIIQLKKKNKEVDDGV